jgi:hypothetical protein
MVEVEVEVHIKTQAVQVVLGGQALVVPVAQERVV